MNTLYDPTGWNRLATLQGQECYLEELLGKTATTLHALREKQNRNERALHATLGPRAKKKKIQQNRWRTNRTIKSCEHEERVILDCLQVCKSNLRTLEAIVRLSKGSSMAADHATTGTPSVYSSGTTNTEGWDECAQGEYLCFHEECRKSIAIDETVTDELVGHLSGAPFPPLQTYALAPFAPRRAPPVTTLVAVPSKTAYNMHSTLSPEAACFEPSVAQAVMGAEKQAELDKLTTTGYLASKRKQQKQTQIWQQQCLSGDALGRMFNQLSVKECPVMLQERRDAVTWRPQVEVAAEEDVSHSIYARLRVRARANSL